MYVNNKLFVLTATTHFYINYFYSYFILNITFLNQKWIIYIAILILHG